MLVAGQALQLRAARALVAGQHALGGGAVEETLPDCAPRAVRGGAAHRLATLVHECRQPAHAGLQFRSGPARRHNEDPVMLDASPIIFLGAVLLFVTAIGQFRQGTGDSRTAMRAALWANFANVPLNFAFIFALELGVLGAALATASARIVELWVLVQIQRKSGFGVSPSWRETKGLLRFSLSTGFERWLDVAAFAALVADREGISAADETVLYWHTLSGADLSDRVANADGFALEFDAFRQALAKAGDDDLLHCAPHAAHVLRLGGCRRWRLRIRLGIRPHGKRIERGRNGRRYSNSSHTAPTRCAAPAALL